MTINLDTALQPETTFNVKQRCTLPKQAAITLVQCLPKGRRRTDHSNANKHYASRRHFMSVALRSSMTAVGVFRVRTLLKSTPAAAMLVEGLAIVTAAVPTASTADRII